MASSSPSSLPPPPPQLHLPESLLSRLRAFASGAGRAPEQVAADAIQAYLDKREGAGAAGALEGPGSPGAPCLRQPSLVPLYIAEPIISLVDGLLEGDHTVADCLRKGTFGLGTLDFLDGEVVLLDGVAYHQGVGGVRVLEGGEHTPFMVVTAFDRDRAARHELRPAGSYEELQLQLDGLLRSQNVVYAVLLEGEFGHVKCRAVGKQQRRARLRDVAEQQVVMDYGRESGQLVGFFCPSFLGSSLSVPGWHFHFLSADRRRGGHVLQLRLERGEALVQEIHRASVDLPSRADWLQSKLTEQPSDELAAAEKDMGAS